MARSNNILPDKMCPSKCSCDSKLPQSKCGKLPNQMQRRITRRLPDTRRQDFRRWRRTDDVAKYARSGPLATRAMFSRALQRNQRRAQAGFPELKLAPHPGSMVHVHVARRQQRASRISQLLQRRMKLHKANDQTVAEISSVGHDGTMDHPRIAAVAGATVKPSPISPLLQGLIGESAPRATSGNGNGEPDPSRNANVNGQAQASSSKESTVANAAQTKKAPKRAVLEPVSAESLGRLNRAPQNGVEVIAEPSEAIKNDTTKQSRRLSSEATAAADLPWNKRKASTTAVPDGVNGSKKRRLSDAKPAPLTNGQSKVNGAAKSEQQAKDQTQVNGKPQAKPVVVSTQRLVALGKWPKQIQRPQQLGLMNPAQLCYRRSVLQSLVSIPHLCSVLTEPRKSACNPGCMACAMRQFTSRYHTEHNAKPTMLDKAIAQRATLKVKGMEQWKTNNIHRQDDALLFMLFLFNAVEEGKCIDREAFKKCFWAETQRSWTCQDCKKTHHHNDPGSPVIPAPINSKRATTVAQCLQNHFAAEDLEIRCDACKSNRRRQRSGGIVHLPEVMTIQLLVFQADPFGRGMSKNHTHVSVPETLDMSSFLQKPADRTAYKLGAVVYHAGGLTGGHYTARARDARDRVWEFDDEVAHPVKSFDGGMRSFTPYILTYIRQ